MRMLRPSPGEAVDRQTILQLKMEHADTGNVSTKASGDKVVSDGETTWGVNKTIMKGASKIDISPFHWEHEELQQYLEKEWFPQFPHIGDTYNLLMDSLKEVNARLWKLEDEARVLRNLNITRDNQAGPVYRAAIVLCEITEANDARAELVQKINALFDVHVVEKMYAS